MTFNEIFPVWYKSKKIQVKESTMGAYLLQWEKHIQPYWGEIEIESVRSRHMQDFVDDYMASGNLSVKTVQDILIIVKSMLCWAQIRYELPTYPIKVVFPTSSKKKHEELEVYTKDEISRIVTYVEKNPSFANMGLLLALTTGLRIGELCALQFCDFDFENHRVRISKTILRLYCHEEHNARTRVVIGTPKTATSNRHVPLVSKLERWYKAAGKICKADYYVLTGTDAYTEPRTYRNYFNRVLDEIGLRRIKFHGLRHSFATRLVSSNVDIKTVASILGHSDASTTLNVYTHSSDSARSLATAKAFKDII